MESSYNKAAFERNIITRAMENDAFRTRLIADPHEALESEMGIRIHGSVDIHIIEEDARSMHLVLPALPVKRASDELTEDELEFVAGGYDIWSYGPEIG